MEKLGLYARAQHTVRIEVINKRTVAQRLSAENAGDPEAFRSRSDQHSDHESPARLKK
jgi:hypothetical protein